MYLLLLAVAPAAGLLYYIWNKDKGKKEPTGLLVGLFFLGAAASIPTVIAEYIVGAGIDSVFGATEDFSYETGGLRFILWAFFTNFFGVALIEEGFKFLFMFIVTKNSRHFDELFDGMIYAVFVSLGFATLENILYVFEGGVTVALTRAVMAVPGHMFFAVFMGYYYSMWHLFKLADKAEEGYARNGLIVRREPRFRYKGYLVLSLVVPVIVHGFYDFCLTVESVLLVLAVLTMMVALYIICFGRIRKMSKADLEDYSLVPLILCSKYPELIGVVSSKSVVPTYSNLKVSEAVAVATQQKEEERRQEEAARMWQYQYQYQYAQYTPQYQQMPVYPPQYQAPPQYPSQAPPQPQYQPQPQNPFFYQPTNPDNPFYYNPNNNS